MRRSASCAEVVARSRRRRRRRRCGRVRRGRRLRRGRRRCAAPRRGSRRDVPRRRDARSSASIAASRHSPSAACSPPPAARCHARRRLERGPRSCALSERAEDAPEMHAGERRQAHVAGRFGLVDRELQRGSAGVVVAGLALRSSETRDLVRLGLQEAEPARRLRGATEVERRRRRTGAGGGPARRASPRGERGATGRRPIASQCST